MEFLDLIFWGIGCFVVKILNKLVGGKFYLGDGGKVVLGFIFFVILLVTLFFLIRLIGVLNYGQ